jgi:hypothetical protein
LCAGRGTDRHAPDSNTLSHSQAASPREGEQVAPPLPPVQQTGQMFHIERVGDGSSAYSDMLHPGRLLCPAIVFSHTFAHRRVCGGVFRRSATFRSPSPGKIIACRPQSARGVFPRLLHPTDRTCTHKLGAQVLLCSATPAATPPSRPPTPSPTPTSTPTPTPTPTITPTPHVLALHLPRMSPLDRRLCQRPPSRGLSCRA